MKYIIMAGGTYNKFKTPKQLLKVNGEVIIERTIRLLKEHGVNDIVISTNNPAFDYIDIPKIRHENKFVCLTNPKEITSENSWLNAYYLMNEPVCYVHGDVYFSEDAISQIVGREAEETLFFAVPDVQDGRKFMMNTKGREPLAFKVFDNEVFNNTVNELKKMIDYGVFKNGVEPIAWHVYRKIHRLELGEDAKDYGFANDVFKYYQQDLVVIDDYTTDIDSIDDVPKLEKILKILKGEIKMTKVEVTQDFTLAKFNELRNIVRRRNDENGRLFIGDVFECTEEMAEYLTGKNALGKAFVKVIEVIPAKEPEVIIEEPKVEVKETVKELKQKRKRKTIEKKD